MNPNQMMIAKAMVAQTALREEAAESRVAATAIIAGWRPGSVPAD
jgi:hypothetical protein